MRLATEVDYDNEENCFNDIAKELSYLFSFLRAEKYDGSGASGASGGSGGSDNENNTNTNTNTNTTPTITTTPKKPQLILTPSSSKSLSDILFPAIRAYFIPYQELTNMSGIIVQIAATEELYKVFERC